MAKAGRTHVSLDVNWYDEWGYSINPAAALLWVLALGQSKRIGSDTLRLDQLRNIAPRMLTPDEVDWAIDQLVNSPLAPVSLAGPESIVLHAWKDWNESPDRATVCPKGWVVSDKMRAWAKKDCPDVAIDFETKQFLDHHKAKGSRFVSWDKAWQTWIRNADKYQKQSGKRRAPIENTAVPFGQASPMFSSNEERDAFYGTEKVVLPGE